MSKRRGPHNRSGSEEVVITIGSDTGSGAYGSLAKTINEELQALGVEINEEMQEVFDEVGKEAVRKLKETSPVDPHGRQSGRYARGWTYEPGKRAKNYKGSGVVRNKSDPQLTHLLEYGHPIVKNGKVVGQADPKEHIRPVADWCAEEINKRLQKELGGK